MKVRATEFGFFDGVRRFEGDEFTISPREVYDKDGKHVRTIPPQQQVGRWMEVIDDGRKKPGPKPKQVEEGEA